MALSLQQIKNEIHDYICLELDVPDKNFDFESNLFEDGYVDSIRLEKLFGFLEEHFGIIFNEDLFFDERISSIHGMAEIIMELKNK